MSSTYGFSIWRRGQSKSIAAVLPGGYHPSIWGNAEMAGGGPYVILYQGIGAGSALSLSCCWSCYLYLQDGVMN